MLNAGWGREDASLATDDGGTGALRATQMHGGAGDRHHQGNIGIPPILTTWIGKRQRRVESGGDSVELEANVCIGGIAWRGNGMIDDGNNSRS